MRSVALVVSSTLAATLAAALAALVVVCGHGLTVECALDHGDAWVLGAAVVHGVLAVLGASAWLGRKAPQTFGSGIMVAAAGVMSLVALTFAMGATLETTMSSVPLAVVVWLQATTAALVLAGPDLAALGAAVRSFTCSARDSPRDWAMVLMAMGPALGMLAGSAVGPLDWDAPWQRWPVAGYLGALSGTSLAAAVVLLVVTCQPQPHTLSDSDEPSAK